MQTSLDGSSRNGWRKSSYSGSTGNTNCVEVALAGTGIVVRDSKNPATGVLAAAAKEWAAFLGAVRGGEFVRSRKQWSVTS